MRLEARVGERTQPEQLTEEEALGIYRRGEVTLSRAAELAGVRYRDLLQRLQRDRLDLNYDEVELRRDLVPLD